MTKTSQIQDNSSLAERSLHGKLVWAAHDFKACSCTAASRRPGTRDDKTHPNLAPPLAQRTVRRSRISESKSDLVAHDSGSWGSVCCMVFLLRFFRWKSKVVLLPFKLRLFREPICKIVCFEQRACLESGQRVSQDVILPKYDFAKISFCQSMILPQYHFAKISVCQNIMLPKYCFAKI